MKNLRKLIWLVDFFSINLVKIKKFGQNQSEIQFEMEGICRINLPPTNVGTWDHP
jgi:hypothetical protein